MILLPGHPGPLPTRYAYCWARQGAPRGKRTIFLNNSLIAEHHESAARASWARACLDKSPAGTAHSEPKHHFLINSSIAEHNDSVARASRAGAQPDRGSGWRYFFVVVGSGWVGMGVPGRYSASFNKKLKRGSLRKCLRELRYSSSFNKELKKNH